jgi:hypothetical protein
MLPSLVSGSPFAAAPALIDQVLHAVEHSGTNLAVTTTLPQGEPESSSSSNALSMPPARKVLAAPV